MIPIVSFVGQSNSGKTTLLEKVVKELKIRGYRIACIKHTHHDFDIDQPGKDTWRLTEAGSDVVAISSPSKVAIVSRPELEPTLAQLAAQFRDQVDIVLAEGFKSESNPKIIVVNGKADREQFYNQENVLITVFVDASSGIPRFADSDVARIVELLTCQIEASTSGPRETATSSLDY